MHTVKADALDRLDNASHFLTLARRGRHAGASGGEKRAAELARAVVDHVPGLDAQAVAGLIDFIHCAEQRPWEASELLD